MPKDAFDGTPRALAHLLRWIRHAQANGAQCAETKVRKWTTRSDLFALVNQRLRGLLKAYNLKLERGEAALVPPEVYQNEAAGQIPAQTYPWKQRLPAVRGD